jgi:hypothetical protein
MHSNQAPSWDEWHMNLLKDGGRRVMNGGNAYEDDLEPAAAPGEQGAEASVPPGSSHPHHE